MGLRRFIRNIRYLSRIELASIYPDMHSMLEDVIYELPGNLSEIARPKIKNNEETIHALLTTKASICRFGDGELTLLHGQPIPFQESDERLSARLKEILLSENDAIFIAIPHFFYYSNHNNFTDPVNFFFRKFVGDLRRKFNDLIALNKQYYDTGFTQIYMTLKIYNFELYFQEMSKIWENKDITILCGDRVFNTIDYNIFDSAKSVEYQYAPTCNAFDSYDEILEEAKKINKERLVIIILGPTATVLAYDLALAGWRALDIGHIAKDYDAYKKQTAKDMPNLVRFFGKE